MKINIKVGNNRFLKKLYENDNKKAILIENMCAKNYYFGKLYYKIKC